jgi:hypothetical protein
MVNGLVSIFLCMTLQTSLQLQPKLALRRIFKGTSMANYSTAIRHCVSSLLVVGLVSAANADTANVAADVVAVGPVELVETSSVTVLGRSYHLDDTAGIDAGDKVAIHGSLLPDGSVAYAWAERLGSYVAGSDSVFETGIVTSVNETTGRLSIGESEIDYTAALSEQGATAPNKGDMVAVAGVQPEIGGVVLGTTTRAGTAAGAMGTPGGGMAGLAGITGSNARTVGITGSNARTVGITGSNARTSGITGSNLGTAGITGSNLGTAGITGSNLGTAGITGSNLGTAGITGSNLGTAGITGSNLGTAGITGSNVRTEGITGSNAAR